MELTPVNMLLKMANDESNQNSSVEAQKEERGAHRNRLELEEVPEDHPLSDRPELYRQLNGF